MTTTTSRPNAATQKELISEHLRDYGFITSWQAIQYYRITRLAEYIRQLRKDMKILSTWRYDKKNNRRWVEYKLQGRRTSCTS